MKKVVLFIGFIIAGFVFWSLCIKPYDYLVSFNVKTTPGTINQSLKLWNSGLKDATIEFEKEANTFKHQRTFNDSLHTYKWQSNPKNDSITNVKVFVTDPKNGFKNRILNPFFNTDFEKRTKKTVLLFIDHINKHLKEIKITLKGESETKSAYCAYVPLKSLQVEKAKNMMQYYSLINGFLAKNNVVFNGTPFLQVTNWNQQTDSISYHFCFPITKKDSLPEHQKIKYKQYTSVKALKAVYNGNYITSDRAWYALDAYAKTNNIKINKTPLEVFYSNPNFGGDELQWKAEIFMPIKE